MRKQMSFCFQGLVNSTLKQSWKNSRSVTASKSRFIHQKCLTKRPLRKGPKFRDDTRSRPADADNLAIASACLSLFPEAVVLSSKTRSSAVQCPNNLDRQSKKELSKLLSLALSLVIL